MGSPTLHPMFLLGLRQAAASMYMPATVSVYRRALALDTAGTAVESWPGMPGQPAGEPAMVLPGRISYWKRVPVEEGAGGTKVSVNLFIIRLPVYRTGADGELAPVVLHEEDRFDSVDPVTGAYTSYKAVVVDQGIAEQATLKVVCEKIV